MRTLWNQNLWGRQLPKNLPKTPIFDDAQGKEKRDKASKRRSKKKKPMIRKPKKKSLVRRLLRL